MEPVLAISSPEGVHWGKRKQSSKRQSNCKPVMAQLGPVLCAINEHQTAANAGRPFEGPHVAGTVKYVDCNTYPPLKIAGPDTGPKNTGSEVPVPPLPE